MTHKPLIFRGLLFLDVCIVLDCSSKVVSPYNVIPLRHNVIQNRWIRQSKSRSHRTYSRLISDAWCRKVTARPNGRWWCPCPTRLCLTSGACSGPS